MNADRFEAALGVGVVLLMVASFIYAHQWIKEDPETTQPTAEETREACISRVTLERPGDIARLGHIQGLTHNNRKLLECN